MDQAAIVNKEELTRLKTSNTVLTHRAHLGKIIPWKPGTLVRTEAGEIEPYLLILQRDRNAPHTVNTQSLPRRLQGIEEMIDTKDLYYAIVLTEEQRTILDSMLINDHFSEETRQVMQIALAYWGYKTA